MSEVEKKAVTSLCSASGKSNQSLLNLLNAHGEMILGHDTVQGVTLMPNKVELLYRHGRQGDVSTAILSEDANWIARATPQRRAFLSSWDGITPTRPPKEPIIAFISSRLIATLARLRQGARALRARARSRCVRPRPTAARASLLINRQIYRLHERHSIL
jgi:hypothetical protein